MTKKCCSCKLDVCKRTGPDGREITKRYFRVPAERRRALRGPKKELIPRRRTLWLQRIFGEIPEKLPKQLWICEDHFVTGCPSDVRDIDHPDWAPSLHMGQSVAVPLQMDQEELFAASGIVISETYSLTSPPDNSQSAANPENRRIASGEMEVEIIEHFSSEDLSHLSDSHNRGDSDSEMAEQEVFFDASDFCADDGSNSVGTQTVKNWKDRGSQQGKACGTQTERVTKTFRTIGSLTEMSMHDINATEDRLKNAQSRLKAFEVSQDWFKDDAVTRYYTGLPNYRVLSDVFELVAPYISYTSRSALSKFQQFALTFMKLRLNLYFTDLAYRFHVSELTAELTFLQCLKVLHCRLKEKVFWPERHLIKATMPFNFKETFGAKSVTVIKDYIEVCCEKASDLMAEAGFKRHQTVKYLIGITPQGFICFVSRSFVGRCSDKYITEHSGFLNHLHTDDVVVSGTRAEDSIGLRMSKVVIPSFAKELARLSPDDFESTQRLENVRNHVGSVVGLLCQKYRILSSQEPLRLLKCDDVDVGLDEIVMVCCSLINFAPGIVPLD